MSVERSNLPDPLAATKEELECLRRQFAEDTENRRIEFEHFKEETLWRLNAMSDRTIEIARLRENEVAMELAEDRKKYEVSIFEWEAQLRERLCDDALLNDVADKVLRHLLPTRYGGELS